MRKLVACLGALVAMLVVSAAADARPHRSEQGYRGQSVQTRVQRVKKVRARYYRGRYATRYAGRYANRAAWRSARVARSYRAARTARSYRAARMARTRSGEESGFSSFASLTGGVGPRPRRWCGWWMRTQLGGGPAFNLAWNWRHYGSPTTAQVGAVVVWRHHVGMITGQAGNGQWIVRSGNDGGRVRERAWSVRGAVFRI